MEPVLGGHPRRKDIGRTRLRSEAGLEERTISRVCGVGNSEECTKAAAGGGCVGKEVREIGRAHV